MKFCLLIATLLFFSCQNKPNSTQTNKDNALINSATDNDQDQEKNSFEKIEYASFDDLSPKSKNKDHIRIGLYYSIDTTGIVTILNDDDYHHTLTFDTYQLNEFQLEKINSIFNSNKPLKNYAAKTKLDKDEFYAGNYDYFSVVYKNGSKDSLCFIVPFMSNDFEKVYDALDSIYWADKKKLKKIGTVRITQSFKNSVLLNYKKSNLPKKATLPAFRLEDQTK